MKQESKTTKKPTKELPNKRAPKKMTKAAPVGSSKAAKGSLNVPTGRKMNTQTMTEKRPITQSIQHTAARFEATRPKGQKRTQKKDKGS